MSEGNTIQIIWLSLLKQEKGDFNFPLGCHIPTMNTASKNEELRKAGKNIDGIGTWEVFCH